MSPALLGLVLAPLLGAPGEGSGFLPPVPETFRLENGLEVRLLAQKKVPIVHLRLLVRAGSAADPEGKAGLAALAAAMLDEGAGERRAIELADEIEVLGAELSTGADQDFTSVSLAVLRRNLEPALDIFRDVILKPRFEEKDWQRVKGLWLNDLEQRREEPLQVARLVADRVLFGDGHPYAHPTDGYIPSVNAVELAEVKAFWKTYVRPDNAVLLCAGDISRDELEAGLEKRLGSWSAEGQGPPAPASVAPVKTQGLRLVVVDKPGAAQTVVRILLPAPSPFAPERAPLTLANSIFGGTFTSRLQMNLREKHQLTYGAGSGLASRRGPSYLAAQSAVKADRTGAALVEFCREFTAMETGEVSEDELQKALATHRIRAIESLATLEGMLGFFEWSAASGRPPDEPRTFHVRTQGEGREGIARECRRTFLWSQAVVVLVGDAALIKKQVPEANRAFEPCRLPPEPEVRDRDGNRAENR
jgi:predicted Zn-dependent peptidase